MTMPKIANIILLILIISSLYIPLIRADDDLMRNASNISVVVPIQGNALLGTTESMYQYNNWLIECAYQMVSLFDQIVDLLGIPNMDYIKKMQESLKIGLKQANASGTSR